MHRRKQTEQKMMNERHVFSHILAAILIYFLIWLTKFFLAVNYRLNVEYLSFALLDLTCKIESTTAYYSFYRLVVVYSCVSLLFIHILVQENYFLTKC